MARKKRINKKQQKGKMKPIHWIIIGILLLFLFGNNPNITFDSSNPRYYGLTNDRKASLHDKYVDADLGRQLSVDGNACEVYPSTSSAYDNSYYNLGEEICIRNSHYPIQSIEFYAKSQNGWVSIGREYLYNGQTRCFHSIIGPFPSVPTEIYTEYYEGNDENLFWIDSQEGGMGMPLSRLVEEAGITYSEVSGLKIAIEIYNCYDQESTCVDSDINNFDYEKLINNAKNSIDLLSDEEYIISKGFPEEYLESENFHDIPREYRELVADIVYDLYIDYSQTIVLAFKEQLFNYGTVTQTINGIPETVSDICVDKFTLFERMCIDGTLSSEEVPLEFLFDESDNELAYVLNNPNIDYRENLINSWSDDAEENTIKYMVSLVIKDMGIDTVKYDLVCLDGKLQQVEDESVILVESVDISKEEKTELLKSLNDDIEDAIESDILTGSSSGDDVDSSSGDDTNSSEETEDKSIFDIIGQFFKDLFDALFG